MVPRAGERSRGVRGPATWLPSTICQCGTAHCYSDGPMLLALVLTTMSVFVEEDLPPPAPTSRWGAVAGTSFRFGANRGVNIALGPRFALLAPPPTGARYATPTIALLVEGDIGLDRGVGAFGAEVRVELLLAPQGGLLVPWVVLWVSGGVGAAWLNRPATELFHVGIGLGGNAFADAGAWGPNHSWADWMEGISWPVVLLATVLGLPLAMLHVEARLSFYPTVTGTTLWPSLLVGFGM